MCLITSDPRHLHNWTRRHSSLCAKTAGDVPTANDFRHQFLTDLYDEQQTGLRGPAGAFLAAHRQAAFLVTVISVGEAAVIFPHQQDARKFLSRYRTLRLTPEVAYAAARIDQALLRAGRRLGENHNWIAAFCRYYGQPIISRDRAFDRVQGLRRLTY
jgi:predicted nucleic acid-binding protein